MEHHHLTPDDWDALAADPEFLALLRAKRRFIIPATIFFIAFYFALLISVGFAPRVMSRPVLGPLTFAYTFALAEFAMAWILLALYLRRAKAFDSAADRIVARAREDFKA